MARQCAAGHPRCECKLVCCQISPERVSEIQADARSGRNWADETLRGAACLCGMKPPRVCHRHPREGT